MIPGFLTVVVAANRRDGVLAVPVGDSLFFMPVAELWRKPRTDKCIGRSLTRFGDRRIRVSVSFIWSRDDQARAYDARVQRRKCADGRT